jgi:Gas vesicle protein K
MVVKKSKRARVRRRSPARRRPRASSTSTSLGALPAEAEALESLRAQLERVTRDDGPPRWNANPEDAKRSVVKLVLTLVELIRQLLERQAIRRMENETLTAEETEAIGLALMRLEETVRELAAQFDLSSEDLNLDLGPIGRLM